MGNLLSFDGKLPACLQSDLDATMVDVNQCARQMIENENHVMNPYTLGIYKNVPKAHGEYVRVLAWDCINFFPGRVLSGGGDGRICVWNEDTFSQLGCIDMRTSVRSLCVTPGCWLSGHSDGLVVAWDVKTLREVARLDIHHEAVYSLLYLPQLNCVVSGAERIVIWKKDVHNFTQVDYLEQEVLCVASMDNWLFTGQMDSDIGVWTIPAKNTNWDQESVRVLRGHKRSVWSMVAIESRGLLASGSADSTMRVWKVGTWECIQTLDFDSWVVNLSFGGSKLVSASNDGSVKVWNVDSWNSEKTFKLDGEVYCCLVFSDGRIASGGADRSVIVYREATSKGVELDLDKTFRPTVNDMESTRRPIIEDTFNNSSNIPQFDAGKEQCRDSWVNPFEFTMSEFQVVTALKVPTPPSD